MNYYEDKMLQDLENRGIGSGIALILTSPLGGIVGMITGGLVGAPTPGFYAGTALFIAFGAGVIAGAVKEKRERHQHT